MSAVKYVSLPLIPEFVDKAVCPTVVSGEMIIEDSHSRKAIHFGMTSPPALLFAITARDL
jgi:hypothetical protein